MGELAIVLAIILCAWVYAALHPYNKSTRGRIGVQVVTVALALGALATGVAEALVG